MKDMDKVKEQLLSELEKMRQEIAELEALETEQKAGEKEKAKGRVIGQVRDGREREHPYH
jgi:hypothetical protein